ncbi:peptidoglycan D,D-transpeptidase FtsI family protein [Helicobacter mustelae]|uniref:Putative penicillin-binding protein n=1 Tax=Helicobacter mustelae (strain ATCC 43772 / CCUG 25715 / CIP 103759 / LMG 18044 / NCTC 12198 / R85-136P) TaxID=679897 RepID=D3UJ25_HELM1|nr:penicillin-binding protein 2 [Helicobacter mustelae]CBG40500.1 putative penicillin-binding protein [Helicobacter mustelae 12198]SQH71999.1 penicillin-binding protein [Helicobacter mustelae]
MNEQSGRIVKVFSVFVVFIIIALLLCLFTLGKILGPNHIPFWQSKRIQVATRGSIYSDDNFDLASSQVLYKVSINTLSIDPDKRELFINLFSIYSGMSREELQAKLKQKGYIVFSYNIPANVAANLRQLRSKLLAYDVFREYQDSSGRIVQKMGIDVEVSGINRNYAYNDALEPVLGYVKKREARSVTIPEGVKGLEKYYNKELSPKQNGIERGDRDIRGNIIRNKTTILRERINGSDIALHVNLGLQRKVEKMLDEFYQQYQVDEIVAGVMDPKSGAIFALATTNRFDPKNITSNHALNASVTERPFEPGSTIKPIVFSILLDKNLINPLELIDLNKGFLQLGRYTIKDDIYPKKNSIVQDILIRSSNVGMIKISRKLSGKEFYEGLKSFGISEASGIDLPYERDGVIPSIRKLSGEAYKASASYGYGLTTTFIQLLRAYGVFCNNGILVTPHLIKNITDPDGKITTPTFPTRQAIAAPTARKIQEILIKTVQEGTGKRAKIDNLIVGGKTGTARIAKSGGGYSDNIYNGSFFGFVKGGNQTYVIGVVVFGTQHKEDYYGSQTAAPIFKEIARIMQKQNFFKEQK